MSERVVQQPVATKTQEKFSNLPTADVQRSTFDMSHPWKSTVEAKYITPCLNLEVLPGDTFRIKTTAFMRLATPLKPIMDSLTADIHYFFTPNRLIWDNWEFFMGERKNLDDDPTTVSIPQHLALIDLPRMSGSLYDYFGLPMVESVDELEVSVNALPFRAYEKIYNDWYRNQNVTQETIVPTGDGPDGPNQLYGLGFIKTRHKRGDYFVRALPWPQKGDPVYLPLGTEAPVLGIGKRDTSYLSQNNTVWEANGQQTEYAWSQIVGGDNSELDIEAVNFEGTGINVPNIRADLTEATAATINDIRTAFQVQRLLERDARGGTRYIEIILSHFSVQSPDFRLQRSEYLGGGSARIIVNPIAATVQTEETPQGNLAAVGTGLVKASMSHSFTEHGILIGTLSCRADATYQQGLERQWTRQTRYDYYWPALSHLGEQPILNQELWYNSTDGLANQEIWGFQERYAEYRYQPGRVSGLFRSEHPESLDVWHLAQDFEELPLLDTVFVIENPPIDRVVAVPSEPDLIVDMWHDVKATRPMPVYAVPGLVDHF